MLFPYHTIIWAILVPWWRQASFEFRKQYGGIPIVPWCGICVEAVVLINILHATSSILLGFIIPYAFSELSEFQLNVIVEWGLLWLFVIRGPHVQVKLLLFRLFGPINRVNVDYPIDVRRFLEPRLMHILGCHLLKGWLLERMLGL